MAEQVSSLKTAIKYKDTPIGKIPVDWEIVRLKDICDEIHRYPTYYNIKYVDPIYGVPEIRGELIKKNGELSDNFFEYRYISKETSFRFPKTILNEGDFVISVRGTMGKIGYISSKLENANITANLMRISPKRDKVYPLWMKQFFISDFFQNLLNQASSATTIKNIKAPELKAIEIALPTLYEQKKIAEILITVDQAIEKTARIIEKIKDVKKGLIQKLFTRGIDHQKFKKTEIGEIPVEWDVRKLGDNDLTKKITQGPNPNYSIGNSVEKYRALRTKDIYDLIIHYDKADRISLETFEECKKAELLDKDILIAIVGKGPIGKFNMFRTQNNARFIYTRSLGLVRVNQKKLLPEFLNQYFHSGFAKRCFDKGISGSTGQDVLQTGYLKIIKIPVPTYEEQRQIVGILSVFDTKIEKEKDYKTELEQFKKGLMQVLLTGKIRVKI